MTHPFCTVSVDVKKVFLYWLSHIIKSVMFVTEISERFIFEIYQQEESCMVVSRVKQTGDTGVHYSKRTPTNALIYY